MNLYTSERVPRESRMVNNDTCDTLTFLDCVAGAIVVRGAGR